MSSVWTRAGGRALWWRVVRRRSTWRGLPFLGCSGCALGCWAEGVWFAARCRRLCHHAVNCLVHTVRAGVREQRPCGGGWCRLLAAAVVVQVETALRQWSAVSAAVGGGGRLKELGHGWWIVRRRRSSRPAVHGRGDREWDALGMRCCRDRRMGGLCRRASCSVAVQMTRCGHSNRGRRRDSLISPEPCVCPADQSGEQSGCGVVRPFVRRRLARRSCCLG